MEGLVEEEPTEASHDVRRVLFAGKSLQLVQMALRPGEEIGEDVHEDRDRFFRVEEGEGEVVIDGVTSKIAPDSAMIVPAGARHTVKNTGATALLLCILYAPPEHRGGAVRATKAGADVTHERVGGKTAG